MNTHLTSMNIRSLAVLFCIFAFSCSEQINENDTLQEKTKMFKCGVGTYEKDGVCLPKVIIPDQMVKEPMPSEDSVIKKFYSDLREIGTYSGWLQNSPGNENVTNYRKVSKKVFKTRKENSFWCNQGKWHTTRIRRITIDKSDESNFLYIASVVYTNKVACMTKSAVNPTKNIGRKQTKGAVKYRYGARTKKWMRAK